MYYYTVYKVTNQINGKFYIGTHKTKDLDDNYMGSGKYLKHSQAKHGIENFAKEILFVFDSPEEMYAKEAEIVNEDFLAEENTYNLKVGGTGGFDYINKSPHCLTEKRLASLEDNRHLGSVALKRKRETDENFRLMMIANSRAAAAISAAKHPNGFFFGKKHTEETKALISAKMSVKQSGDNNSQFGSRWIHSVDEKRNRKVKKDEILPEGWSEGRKMKFL